MQVLKNDIHKFVRKCLQNMSLAKVRNQQIAAIIFAVSLFLMVGLSVAYSWAKVFFVTEDNTRDYRYIPFDIYDATMVCNEEMEARMGDTLLRSYVDQRSTHLDSRKGLYRVYIKADVGTKFDFREVNVYCFVDKWDYDLSYYKAVDPKAKKIMPSDFQFFK